MIGCDAERIEDAYALAYTLGATSGGDVSELALGVGHHNRSLVEEKVRDDDVSAFALTAAGDGQHVAVEMDADEALADERQGRSSRVHGRSQGSARISAGSANCASGVRCSISALPGTPRG